MPYIKEYYDELNGINILIDKNEIQSATVKFRDYLKKVNSLGRFSPKEWNNRWRDEVYVFGEKFRKIDPVDFLKIIQEEKTGLEKDNQEVLDFFKSEIEINNQPYEDSSKEINKLINKYPYNPEFRHDFGHLLKAKNDLLGSIEQYKFALKRDESNSKFLKQLFNTQKQYIEDLIDKNEYKKAFDYCSNIQQEGLFKDNYVFHNILIGVRERLKDYLILEQKLQDAEISFRKTVKEETDNERKRLIEILGFFSAIIAFIFSTVSIGENFNFHQALSFVVSLGLILIIFLVTINILFSNERIRYSHPKFLILVILILSLLLVFSKLLANNGIQ